jgi:nicotinamide-nucleotide adenylyltransferase
MDFFSAIRGIEEMSRGLYIGRFQPFHKGHLEVVKNILEKVDELVIVIGSAQYSHQPENVFTAGERMTMIAMALEEAKLDSGRCHVVPVIDTMVHSVWVSHVESYVPKFEVVFTNEPLTKRLFNEANIKVEEIPKYKRNVYSSTEARRRMIDGENWEELVPKSVAGYINSIDGVERLRDLFKTDKV